jgi:antimicrobial peptide system SdpB family protein
VRELIRNPLGFLDAWAAQTGELSPFGRVLQCGRSFLAIGTLITLLANSSSVLFHNPTSAQDSANCAQFGQFGLYCLLGDGNLEIARWLSVAACLLVVSGFLPVLSSALYWFAAASLFANAKPVDGGDQITSVLAAILMATSLLDWRWSAWSMGRQRGRRFIIARVLLCFVPLQMGYLYLNSAVSKFSAPIWADGSALWYWLQHPGFDAAPAIQQFAWNVLQMPIWSAVATWGVLALELLLAFGIFFARKRASRMSIFVIGVAFHVLIAVLMGLVSFAIAMIAGVLLATIRPGDLAAVKRRLSRDHCALQLSPNKREVIT